MWMKLNTGSARVAWLGPFKNLSHVKKTAGCAAVNLANGHHGVKISTPARRLPFGTAEELNLYAQKWGSGHFL